MLSFNGHVMMYGGSEVWGGVRFHALVYFPLKSPHIMICEVSDSTSYANHDVSVVIYYLHEVSLGGSVIIF